MSAERPPVPARRRWTTLLCAAIAWLTAAGTAGAADYGVFIDVETEEELLDLLGAQEIEEETFETLRELLSDGVDLNTADREELYTLPNLTYADVDAILAYRKAAGVITDPAALVAADVLSERKLLAIAPFLLVGEVPDTWLSARGRLRYKTAWVAGDDEVPGMMLGARVTTLRHLEAGVIGVLTRTRVSDVVYDPNRSYLGTTGRGALSAEPPSVQVQVPKFYLQWETRDWHLVGGTFRIGFGQRLVFDTTSQVTPNGIRVDDTIYTNQDLAQACRESAGELPGSPCTGEAGNTYQAPDYRWTDRLRGVAIGLKRAEIGDGWLQAYGFASYQTHSIYQYEIVDRRYCDDPANDDLEACAAPEVFVRQDDPLAATSKLKYATLPDMFNLLSAGGNLTYHFGRRAHLGLTGYGAGVSWLVDGIDLDFQEWSRFPWGGGFGAVGLDAAWGIGRLDLFAEAGRSFDGQPAGGGWAALLRSTLSFSDHELEAALRYYGRDYANPFARPISAADEYDGLRARDESGLRLRYLGEVGELEIRSTTDFWMQLSEETPRARVEGRADYRVTPWFRPGLWVEYQDRDLTQSGRANCYDVPFETIEGEPVPCSGEKYQVGAQLRFTPTRRLAMTAKYQHRWLDDGQLDDRFRQDLAGWLVVLYRPIDPLRLRLRVRYLFEEISDNTSMEQSVWTYLEASWQLERTLRVQLRYEVYAWVDDRTSTAERIPNPAHWLRLDLEYRF